MPEVKVIDRTGQGRDNKSMGYRIFIGSYVKQGDINYPYRIKIIADSSGIESYLDLVIPRSRKLEFLEKSDAIIGIITRKTVKTKEDLKQWREFRHTINYGRRKNKPTIILTVPDNPLVSELIDNKRANKKLQVIPLKDKSLEGEVLRDLREYLEAQKQAKEAKSALITIAAIALSLYILDKLTD